MEFIQFIQQRNWTALFGYLLFIGMMAAGYFYNLTFVQFGLLDLGTRRVGMSETGVAQHMALLALITSMTAITFGWWMGRRGWSASFLVKLRLAFGVVLAQTLLTGVISLVTTATVYLLWIVAASLALGVGVPVMFSLTVDLVPVRSRGMAGAWVAAAAYGCANLLNSQWTIEWYQTLSLGILIPGAIGVGVLAFAPLGLRQQLAEQHKLPTYSQGRFVRRRSDGKTTIRRSLLGLFFLMFGIYFIDSLGFLRLTGTSFFEAAWQSPALEPRLMLAAVHIVAALVAGVLYAALDEKELFLWVFGIFALVHLMYSLALRTAPGAPPTLAEPLMYAIAVSLDTVINFAVWADVSTPATISRNTAVGVSISGWTATFASTALSLQMRQMGVSLDTHLRIVDSLAILFFLLVLGLVYFSGTSGTTRDPGQVNE